MRQNSSGELEFVTLIHLGGSTLVTINANEVDAGFYSLHLESYDNNVDEADQVDLEPEALVIEIIVEESIQCQINEADFLEAASTILPEEIEIEVPAL